MIRWFIIILLAFVVYKMLQKKLKIAGGEKYYKMEIGLNYIYSGVGLLVLSIILFLFLRGRGKDMFGG